MSEAIISVQNLTKSYRLYNKPSDRLKETLFPWKSRHKLFNALSDVSFSVEKGKHLGVIGTNGAGKSTLLQIITGVLTPSSGKVAVNGNIAALLELGAGFNAELTGRENILFLAPTLGITNDNSDAFVQEIVNFAELGEFIDQPVKVYSSGMFARLAFSMNISSLPDILIVDEALAVGDAFFQQKCLRRMKNYSTQGTILFVSHDISSVMELCDSVVWLEKGRVREYGPAREVCEHYISSSYENAYADMETIEQELNAHSPEPAAVKHCPRSEEIADKVLAEIEKLKQQSIADFDNKDSFGEGDARILRCTLENTTRESATYTYEDVCRMSIYFKCSKDISNIIAGFILKDRRGNAIYGTNSFRYCPCQSCKAGETYAVIFEFAFPDLAPGEYMLTLAVAEGTLQAHRQLHWIYDAMPVQFESKENDGTIVAAKCRACMFFG